MLEAKEPTRSPTLPFLRGALYHVRESRLALCKDAVKAGTPCLRTDSEYPPPSLGDTLLRFGLRQPSLVQAWAVRPKTKPTDGEGDAADHLFGLGSDSEGSDWE